MSRCFPFPPPGYIKKTRAESIDSVDLLKQDKLKDKKDKKEKNRVKLEGKERKENDLTDEKHKDKKEKKDKHRDKKEKERDKEKRRDKDHSSSSNDKKLPLQTGAIDKEKTPTEKGPLLPLLPVGQAGDRSIRKENERDVYRNSTPDGRRPIGQNINKTTATNNNSLRDTGDNNKYVHELKKRVRNDMTTGTQLAEKFMVAKRNDATVVQFSSKPSAGVKPEGREWNKEQRDNEQKLERVNGTLKVQKFDGAFQSRVQDITTPLEQKNGKEMEWRERSKGREGDDKWGDKSREKDREKKSQGQVELIKGQEVERTTERSEINKHSNQERLKFSRNNELLSSPNVKGQHQPAKEPKKMVAVFSDNINKRKVPEANGFLHANEIRLTKMPKQTLASHPPLENGRILESYPGPAQVSPPSGPTTNSNNIVRAKEDKKINGVKDTRPTPPISSPFNIQLSTLQVNSPLNEVPSVGPPHPDSRYLDEILSRVTRMEELPELGDDQGWLFDSKSEDSKKSHHMQVDQLPQVWGESLHIGSADIYALPYVVPF
ncbi:hypothetical protein SAY87_010241 [Trapa incisa]|uniref:Myb-like protein X n=1 Tax=Trapa incisa TaxID=236973 RepID=A0AAN7GL81_9MYRT|nr:hypothetical protein SAY87_010241 [Trapa incisa]